MTGDDGEVNVLDAGAGTGDLLEHGADVSAGLIVDLDGDGTGEAVFFSLRPVATVLKYRPQKKQWASVRTLYLEKVGSETDIIAQLKQGDFKLKTPAYSDLSVGGVLWEQTR